MILWGFLSQYLNSIAATGFNFIPALLGAVLLWDFFHRIMHGVAIAFLEDVWSRNFLNLFTSPLSIGEYAVGLIATSTATSVVGLFVMILIATSFFGLSILSYGLIVFPFIVVLLLSGVALGLVGTAIILRWGPAAEWLIWPLPALFSPFVGVFYPLSTLPSWMQWIAHLLPPSYVFEGLRIIVKGGSPDWNGLLIGLALSGLYVLMAMWCLIKTYRSALQSGLIARYAAESVN